MRRVGCVYHFIVTKGDIRKSWTVDLSAGNGRVVEGAPKAPAQCTVHLTDSDLADIIDGKLQPEDAYLEGKVQLEGDAKYV